MQLTNSGLVCSPSDLNHFVECEHLTALDLLAIEGNAVAKEKDPQAEILRAKGFEHEQAWLQHLRDEGREIVEIAVNGNADWHRDAERTAAAMRNGAEVIYQAVFVDNDWRGVADFLIRVDRASQLGPWSYEACDAKLARHPKPYFILQLAWYTEQLARIQGLMPEHMQVVLGTRETMAFRPNDFLAYYRVRTDAQRASLVRIGDAFVAGSDRHRVGRDLLTRAMPRIAGRNPGSILQTMNMDEQKALVGALDESYLFIQGPPGSGKTYIGARLIVSLLEAGKRVAVTATSHKAIHNLLDNVIVAAREARVEVRGLKKTGSGDDSVYEGEGFENTSDNRECAGSDANLVAGTSWLFARGEMESQFDTLFIDEAGQVALADAVAMSPCARNVVLLGDPQQLPHVTQGIHPGGAGVSVLEHLLGDEATVGPDRGLFLDRTWRMHPDVCGFISDLAYDGRLHSVERCAAQAIDSAGLSGTGLRYVPVEHTGNSQQSFEEAALIAAETRRLLDTGTFTDCFGVRRPFIPADILVVAPYNMQVRALLQAVPAGVEVGTVDKFQGREAPIVFFSMASSSGEDIPRGVEFLFSRNRLNVAVSRAKAMAVLVCSPRLLETRCRTVDQMRLVNGLCKFVEHPTRAAYQVADARPAESPRFAE